MPATVVSPVTQTRARALGRRSPFKGLNDYRWREARDAILAAADDGIELVALCPDVDTMRDVQKIEERLSR